MKTTPRLTSYFAMSKSSTLLIAIAALACCFWLSTSGRLFAGSTCSVCHKRTTTLTFICGELEYQRHLDHGDPMGACAASRGALDPKVSKADSPANPGPVDQ